jgi:hypothetical protein
VDDNCRSLDVQFDAGGTELVGSIDALLAETYLSIIVRSSQFRTLFEMSD